ncbi:MAG: nucleotidyltransferase domain-containing protein [Muribaculaceae bacterium]
MVTREGFIQALTRVAKDTLPPKSSLFLFGSRARCDENALSDWDLLILLDKPSLTYSDYGVGYPLQELGWSLGQEVNPQVYSKSEWQECQFTPFYKNVETDKIVLL